MAGGEKIEENGQLGMPRIVCSGMALGNQHFVTTVESFNGKYSKSNPWRHVLLAFISVLAFLAVIIAVAQQVLPVALEAPAAPNGQPLGQKTIKLKFNRREGKSSLISESGKDVPAKPFMTVNHNLPTNPSHNWPNSEVKGVFPEIGMYGAVPRSDADIVDSLEDPQVFFHSD